MKNKGLRMQQMIEIVANDPKAAGAVGVATAATGFSHWLDLFTGWISFFAALAGLILSITLIYVHWTKHRREVKIYDLEMKKIVAREKEKMVQRRRRIERGESLRRNDDNGLFKTPPND